MSIQELLDFLGFTPPGPIIDIGQLETLLARCWDEFDGADAEGMEGYKLHGRMEEVSWEPPVLNFRIARHGGTTMGSTREELHDWKIDLERRSATCCTTGRYRQLEPRSPRLDVKPIAELIVGFIVKRQPDDRLKWNSDGSVRVLIGSIIPSEGVYKATLEGRRRRFRTEVDKLLAHHGWHKVRPNVYTPKSP